MARKLQNVLIFGTTSDIAEVLLHRLLNEGVNIYSVSRSKLAFEHDSLYKFNCDCSIENDIENLFEMLPKIKFDAVINFVGVAISSPVELLKKEELQKQLDTSLFSLLLILKNLKGRIKKDGMIVSVSSMASFGIFPFLSPYSIAKASSDMLLTAYEIETGIKTVSIKPGVIGTKFWKFCVDENEENFERCLGEYENAGKFLKDNALKNAAKGITPDKVSKLIYKIINLKNPKSSYLIGKDAYSAAFASLFKGRILFSLVRKILNTRIKRFLDGK